MEKRPVGLFFVWVFLFWRIFRVLSNFEDGEYRLNLINIIILGL